MLGRTSVVLLAWLLVPLLAGCGTGSVEAPHREDPHPLPQDALRVDTAGRVGGTLRYPLAGEPATFNPLAARDSRSRLLAFLTTGTLLEFDRLRHEAVPGVARQWQVAADGKTVILDLRQGVRFSDGTPVEAEDVVFTLAKVYEEGSRNVLQGSLMVDGRPLRARVLSPDRVEIEFPEAYAAAEYVLSQIPVLPRHLLAERGRKIEEYWNLETRPESMAGLGPFRVASHRPGERSVLRRNPHYWKADAEGNRLPYLDEIVLHYIESREGQLLRFQAGQLDLMDRQLRPEDFALLERDEFSSGRLAGPHEGGVRVHSGGPSSELSFFWFNLSTGRDASGRPHVSPEKQGWFGDVRFRRAVAQAISREDLVRNVYMGKARPAWSLVPHSLGAWHAPDLPRPDYSPERARERLKEAGFGWEKAGAGEVLVDSRGQEVRFEILTQSDEILSRVAAVIQQDLERIGIQSTLRQEEFRTVIARIMESRAYDAAIMKLEFSVEPVDHMGMLLSSGSMHFWNPAQPEPATDWERRIDELMLRQRSLRDREERRRLYHDVQWILAEEFPIIPLVNADTLVAARGGLSNLRPAAVFPYAFWNVWELYWETDR